VGRQTLSFVLRGGISLALLALLPLLGFVDLGRTTQLIVGADPPFLLLAVALLTGDRFLMAAKWRLLLQARDVALPLGSAARAYYVASFAGLFLPMTVGADVVRTFAVAPRFRTPTLVASIILERALGALSQALLATCAAFLLAHLAGVPLGALGWGLGAVILLAGLACPLSFPVARWFTRWPVRSPLMAKLQGWAQVYLEYSTQRGVLILFLLLSLVEGLFPVAIHYAAGRALGLQASLALYMATIPIVFLIARIPVSLGGIGVVESSFVVLAGRIGLGATEAFALALLAEVLLLISLLPGALFALQPIPAHSEGKP